MSAPSTFDFRRDIYVAKTAAVYQTATNLLQSPPFDRRSFGRISRKLKILSEKEREKDRVAERKRKNPWENEPARDGN